MYDTTTEPITLQAYDPRDLLTDANARTGAQATVTKADAAVYTTIAASRPDGCGNNVPITIVARPDGRLRVRAGHRRTIGCLRAGVPVLGFVAGAEGDERADRRARLIEQWNENHHRVPMTVGDDTWLAGYETRRPSTVRQAKVHLRQVTAEFGAVPLAGVRPSHVRPGLHDCWRAAPKHPTSTPCMRGWRRS